MPGSRQTNFISRNSHYQTARAHEGQRLQGRQIAAHCIYLRACGGVSPPLGFKLPRRQKKAADVMAATLGPWHAILVGSLQSL
jgi:hypothetical protein